MRRNRPHGKRHDQFVGDDQGLGTTQNASNLNHSKNSQLLSPKPPRSDSYLDWNVLASAGLFTLKRCEWYSPIRVPQRAGIRVPNFCIQLVDVLVPGFPRSNGPAGIVNFQPIYFAGRHGPLYGVHHFPDKGLDLQHAILIMPAMGQEYVRCHKTLQKLATDLATLGYHVLRFDYTGTGDSSDGDGWDLETWKRDSLNALEHLSGLSSASCLSLVGVRLGASLALSLDLDIESVVVWDPIASGADYLREMETLNAELFEICVHSLRSGARVKMPADELVGHAITQAMRSSLGRYSLASEYCIKARRILWIDVEPTACGADFSSLEQSQGASCSQQHVGMACYWNSPAEVGNLLLGQPVARVILDNFRSLALNGGRGA